MRRTAEVKPSLIATILMDLEEIRTLQGGIKSGDYLIKKADEHKGILEDRAAHTGTT